MVCTFIRRELCVRWMPSGVCVHTSRAVCALDVEWCVRSYVESCVCAGCRVVCEFIRRELCVRWMKSGVCVHTSRAVCALDAEWCVTGQR